MNAGGIVLQLLLLGIFLIATPIIVSDVSIIITVPYYYYIRVYVVVLSAYYHIVVAIPVDCAQVLAQLSCGSDYQHLKDSSEGNKLMTALTVVKVEL